MNCLLILSLAVLGASASPVILSGNGCGNVVSGLGCGNVVSTCNNVVSGCNNVVSGCNNLVSGVVSGCNNVVSGCNNVVSGVVSGCNNLVSGVATGEVLSGNVISGNVLQGRTLYAQTPVIENPTSVIPPILPSTAVAESCHRFRTVVRPQLRNEIINVPTVDRIVRVVTTPVVEVSSVYTGGNTRNVQVPTCNSFEGANAAVAVPVSTGFQGVVGGCSQGFVNTGIVGNTGCGCNVIA